MKIYYAHAMCIYGTKDEEVELLHIKQNFPDHSIVDPGTYAKNPDKRKDGMEYCQKYLYNSGIAFKSRFYLDAKKH